MEELEKRVFYKSVVTPCTAVSDLPCLAGCALGTPSNLHLPGSALLFAAIQALPHLRPSHFVIVHCGQIPQLGMAERSSHTLRFLHIGKWPPSACPA